MSEKSDDIWARFRFSVIGPLLARPPKRGMLQKELEALAGCIYKHPVTGENVRFGRSTIEAWYYKALRCDDPLTSLNRKTRKDAGIQKTLGPELMKCLEAQYHQHPRWSYQLHADNLAALAEQNPELGDAPSYATILRRMQERGWLKKAVPARPTPGRQRAAERLEKREVRSFESEYVHALWHLDFHESRRKIVGANGAWYTPKALCVLDDRSRLCCHIQWYTDETAETLYHGLMQAFHKRGLPRALMTDNGAAMLAQETQNGLVRLGVLHETTLPYSAYQNGKQESFWGQLEGRLLAMLEHVDPLTLDFLNEASQAWIEQEYNRKIHSELGTSPLRRMLDGADQSRPSPDTEAIHQAFTRQERRVQRKSDGTISLQGVRFEIPSRFRHLPHIHVRYQSWDMSIAYIVDSRSGRIIGRIHPQDKAKNADGHRRSVEPTVTAKPAAPDADPIPPLLRKILSDYAATGMPPAYLPVAGKEVDNDA